MNIKYIFKEAIFNIKPVYLTKIETRGKFEIWKVDGAYIRTNIEEERGYVLFHELHERNKMALGWHYDLAHQESSKLELFYRQNPDELHDALINEGWA